jgi:hypothetical protein
MTVLFMIVLVVGVCVSEYLKVNNDMNLKVK